MLFQEYDGFCASSDFDKIETDLFWIVNDLIYILWDIMFTDILLELWSEKHQNTVLLL